MYPVMKVRKSVERRAKLAVKPRKFVTHKNTRDLVKLNEYWRVVQWVKSFGEIPMTGFHTWHCMCEGASQDSSYGHEESHLMHDMKYSISDCIFCIECGLMYACYCMYILGGE